MSTTTTGTDTPTRPDRTAEYQKFKYYTAITFLVASPILIALPPRKLDFYTASLTGAFLLSSNHITRERTGRGITEHLSSRLAFQSPSIVRDLPGDRAEEVRARLRAEREREGKRKIEEEKGVVESIWMGGETEGWKERRLREEQKALDEGKGYGDLIKEYVWDVWNWGDEKGKGGGGEEGKN